MSAKTQKCVVTVSALVVGLLAGVACSKSENAEGAKPAEQALSAEAPSAEPVEAPQPAKDTRDACERLLDGKWQGVMAVPIVDFDREREAIVEFPDKRTIKLSRRGNNRANVLMSVQKPEVSGSSCEFAVRAAAPAAEISLFVKSDNVESFNHWDLIESMKFTWDGDDLELGVTWKGSEAFKVWETVRDSEYRYDLTIKQHLPGSFWKRLTAEEVDALQPAPPAAAPTPARAVEVASPSPAPSPASDDSSASSRSSSRERFPDVVKRFHDKSELQQQDIAKGFAGTIISGSGNITEVGSCGFMDKSKKHGRDCLKVVLDDGVPRAVLYYSSSKRSTLSSLTPGKRHSFSDCVATDIKNWGFWSTVSCDMD